jgi:hypothetical protein
MALAVSYDATLGRLRLEATLLGATATHAVFYRAVDGGPFEELRGGIDVTVAAQNAQLDVYEFPPGVPVDYWVNGYNAANVQVSTFGTPHTQDIDVVWLKVVARPFLNRTITVAGRGEVGRPARGGVFNVVGRSFGIAVSDFRSSRQYVLEVLTETPAEEDALALLLASGEPVYLQAPSTQTKIPGGEGTYWNVGDTTEVPTGRISDRRIFALPLKEVAPPGADVVGAAGTWQSVVSEYATWADVIAAHTTWADLLELVGDPTEVIVP